MKAIKFSLREAQRAQDAINDNRHFNISLKQTNTNVWVMECEDEDEEDYAEYLFDELGEYLHDRGITEFEML
jgi:hypothetical protein